jgi:transcriptional regulator with XRE-family HTH domain
MSLKRFAMRLRKLREAKGLTQAVLAHKAGVTRGYLSRIEMGRHDPPLSRVQRLAKALGVRPSALID